MIKSLFLRGRSSITRQLGGNDANAPAAKVSIIRLTHSIWVIVKGDDEPNNEPNSTMRQAATFIVSWNSKKRCMFL